MAAPAGPKPGRTRDDSPWVRRELFGAIGLFLFPMKYHEMGSQVELNGEFPKHLYNWDVSKIMLRDKNKNKRDHGEGCQFGTAGGN